MAVSESISPGLGRVYGLDKSGQRPNVTVHRSVQGGGRAIPNQHALSGGLNAVLTTGP